MGNDWNCPNTHYLKLGDLFSASSGSAYAIWSGVGMVLVTLIAWLVLGQTLDGPVMLGLTLIVAGVIVLNVFSRSVTH
jgi:small multidrug resistance pump